MVQNTATVTAGENLSVLRGDDKKKGEGSWVFTQQGVAAEQGFRNTSKFWYAKTQSYEDGLQALAEGKAKTIDILATVREMTPSVDDKGLFIVKHPHGRTFRPTEFAMGQMGGWANAGTWFVQNLLGNPEDYKGRQLYSRDRGDAETLAQVLRNGNRRIEDDKKFLFRTREDGTLRAMLSTSYAVVDNAWYLETLKKLVPGGRLSHWKGDSDTVYGNVLIPDTIREEKDSDYGGMLSIGNSEIGERRVTSLPSIFRAICMNGCIWGATVGRGIKQVHRGKIDMAELFLAIKTNLEMQIPLLPQGIEKLLGVRSLAWDGASVMPLFAQVSIENKLTKKMASGLLEAYNVERAIAPEYARTLFGVVNSITRAGQKFDPATWVRLDEVGGGLAAYDQDDWHRLVSRAKSLKAKDVEAVFANAV